MECRTSFKETTISIFTSQALRMPRTQCVTYFSLLSLSLSPSLPQTLSDTHTHTIPTSACTCIIYMHCMCACIHVHCICIVSSFHKLFCTCIILLLYIYLPRILQDLPYTFATACMKCELYFSKSLRNKSLNFQHSLFIFRFRVLQVVLTVCYNHTKNKFSYCASCYFNLSSFVLIMH